MAPKTKTHAEFPLLDLYGLKATNITGDGNCLFNALSDQIYGDESKNMEIRANVVRYMRENKEDFLPFVVVNEGGGQRRNPKRKNTAAPKITPVSRGPSEAEREDAFEERCRRMARFGTYGDNMEITAFTKYYNYDVRIFSYSGQIWNTLAANDGKERPVAWIAHHSWEHYSSVRNEDGPFKGLPNVQAKNFTEEQAASTKALLDKGPTIQDWQIEMIQRSIPNPPDEYHIRLMIRDQRGNLDNVISKFLENDEYSSTPGTPGRLSDSGSSSVEREADSDDEDFHAPNKKQDRKKSRVTKPTKTARKSRVANNHPVSVPTVEVTRPDPETIPHPSIEAANLEIPALMKLRNINDAESIITSEGDETTSEYTASGSSRAQSTTLSTPPPRPRIILRTAGQKAKLERQRANTSSQETTPPPTAKEEEQLTPESEKKPRRKLITAREMKMLKKAEQKKAAKERKQQNNKGNNKLNPRKTKGPSPPVQTLGTLSMIQI